MFLVLGWDFFSPGGPRAVSGLQVRPLPHLVTPSWNAGFLFATSLTQLSQVLRVRVNRPTSYGDWNASFRSAMIDQFPIFLTSWPPSADELFRRLASSFSSTLLMHQQPKVARGLPAQAIGSSSDHDPSMLAPALRWPPTCVRGLLFLLRRI